MTDPTSATPVRVERDGHVAVVTIDRPEARNAVDTAVATGLSRAFADAEADPDVWCLVLTGAGDRSFSAGADLKALLRGELPFDPDHPERGFAGVVDHPVSVPVVTAVNGTALGGGTELVLASDLCVAAEHASFGLPEVARGLIAAAGGAFRLPQQIPHRVAMRVLLTGEPIDAREAERWGLVNEVVPADQLLDRALALAGLVTRNAPLAVQATKRVALGITDDGRPDERDTWTRNQAALEAIGGTADVLEGMQAFAEKRAPRWQAR
ncbi:crotonase/enoyl-CoA hydratase family protein [Nitriliruptoraceae bacterium ZYF776]|nr:crotonase/enoyl-CoA hydratase family protein [Profundirhabdus halotolerans]